MSYIWRQKIYIAGNAKMIIADKFVMLNMPKTGSSFARKAIKQVYKNRRDSTWYGKYLGKLGMNAPGYSELFLKNKRGALNQHGHFFEVPPQYKNKVIVSVVRNPYQRAYSGYRFGFWKQSCEEYPWVRDIFPTFPDLTFEEFLEMRRYEMEEKKEQFGIDPKLPVGYQTFRFIQMYFKNPA